MQRATTLLAIGLAALIGLGVQSAAAERKAASPAELLGQAQRAFEAGQYTDAARLSREIDLGKVVNDDYVLYIRGQSDFLTGKHRAALASFRKLARMRGSQFRGEAPWRIADCQWELGNRQTARKAYQKLLRGGAGRAEEALTRYRIATANRERGKTRLARRQLRALLIDFPLHPVIERVEDDLRELGGDDAVALSARDRIERAKTMTSAHDWHQAIEELRRIGDDVPDDVALLRDYWTGITLFKMRRRYGDAGEILTRIYKKMGSDADYALFHGARGLSRADRDKEAIDWYQRVVAEYPRSRWAAEAQYLAGWLEFNLGNYQAAIPGLARTRSKYSRSRYATEALWFQGFSHFLLGQYDDALPLFEKLAKKGNRLRGGKGHYWQARTLEKLGRTDDAVASYRELVGRYPFSWYALLARSRLAERKVDIDIFGDDPPSSNVGTRIAEEVDESLARDPLIRTADELIAAGLTVEAGNELRRGEKAFLKRQRKQRDKAFAILLDRYRRADNYNRPWYLGVVYGRKALQAPPKGQARVWWQHAYPKAYEELVEEHRGLGGSPPYWLYSIMRKESGFNPHVLSYADAYGLLQMIPPTTRRVVDELGIPYTDDMLWDPELNIKTGSWYIGRLFHKFKGQVPISAGSYNSGPRPWMRWIDENGARPMDEFIELVSYSQTREYAKKLTETYARYLYLYEGEVYRQPLTVDRDYVVDDLTY